MTFITPWAEKTIIINYPKQQYVHFTILLFLAISLLYIILSKYLLCHIQPIGTNFIL